MATEKVHTKEEVVLLSAILVMLVIGPSNFVLYKLLFSTYGGESAFFVMQGVNVLFVVYGGIVLASLRRHRNFAAMDALPRYPFAAMAALDCIGGLCAALGAASTPGQLQTLLNQSLVPCTMVASAVFLRTRYAWCKCVGAFIILCGAIVVIRGAEDEFRLPNERRAAILVYWASNIPMALSSVYKEHRFGSHSVDVMYLTQQVSIFQLIFGFFFAPFQSIPGVATADGVSLNFVLRNFIDETYFFFADPLSPKTLLLVSYVLANFVLNTTGLFVVKHGGAALSAIAYSILWPCSTLAFALPFLGPYQEPLRTSTLVGLAIVFGGFALYELDELSTLVRGGGKQRRPYHTVVAPGDLDEISAEKPNLGGPVPPPEPPAPLAAASEADPLTTSRETRDDHVAAFQERIMLVPVIIRRAVSE